MFSDRQHFFLLQTDDGLVGDESPYLGKGRFKKNERIRQRQLAERQAQQGTTGVMGAEGPQHAGHGDGGLSYEEIRAKALMNENMDRELEDKHNAIEGGMKHCVIFMAVLV